MFLLKALAGVSLLLVSTQVASGELPPVERLYQLLPADEPAQPDIVFQTYPLVHRVDCGQGRGTAFRVGDNHWMSAAHVTRLSHCRTDAGDIRVTEQDDHNDFARFDTADGVPNGMPIDCGGFKPGRWYWSVGHALGAPFQTNVAIYAAAFKSQNGFRIFIGRHTVIPGMSGGPIMDETGKVVGTVNAYDPSVRVSLSRELKDTSVCSKS